LMAAQDEDNSIKVAIEGAFGEVGNAVSFSLSEKVGRDVRVGPPQVETVDAATLAGTILPGACGMQLDLTAAGAGPGMLLFDGPLGRALAGLLAGDAEPKPDAELDDERLAKLGEIGTSIATALAGTLGLLLGKGGLAFAVGDAKPEVESLGGDVAEGDVLHVSLPLELEGGVSGAAHLVAPTLLLDQLTEALAPVAQPTASEPGGELDHATIAAIAAQTGLEPAELPPAVAAPATGAAAAARAAEAMPVEPASFSPFTAPAGVAAPGGGLDLILDVPLEVTVELGRTRMLIKDILELASGSIIELEAVAGEAVDVVVNGKLVAKGEVVVIEDNFGVRVTEIVAPIEKATGL
jgi:flagellar motor switch protein FliN/FliY